MEFIYESGSDDKSSIWDEKVNKQA